jgi:hypothetical protein
VPLPPHLPGFYLLNRLHNLVLSPVQILLVPCLFKSIQDASQDINFVLGYFHCLLTSLYKVKADQLNKLFRRSRPPLVGGKVYLDGLLNLVYSIIGQICNLLIPNDLRVSDNVRKWTIAWRQTGINGHFETIIGQAQTQWLGYGDGFRRGATLKQPTGFGLTPEPNAAEAAYGD